MICEKIARWAYEYNRHGFWGKAISVPPHSINNDGSLMQIILFSGGQNH